MLTLQSLNTGRDIKFDVFKFEALQVANILEDTEFSEYAQRIRNCALTLKYKICEDGEKFNQAYFCRVRCCPMCNWRKSQMWRGRALKVIEYFKNRKFIFATFTIRSPNLSDLKTTLIRMKSGFKKMSLARNKLWQADGYIRSLEISKGEIEGKCHPHYHCILRMKENYEEYMETHEWSQMWRKYLKIDYDPIVDVRFIKNAKKSIPEIFKYICKSYDLKDKEFLITYMRCSKGMHNVELGGYFAQLFKPEEPTENLVHSGLNDEYSLGNYINFKWELQNEKSFEGNDLWAYQC